MLAAMGMPVTKALANASGTPQANISNLKKGGKAGNDLNGGCAFVFHFGGSLGWQWDGCSFSGLHHPFSGAGLLFVCFAF